ncbi:PA14 domain-containing protein [Cavenderia fasciculata]|uniref:PA14 domain-containing protein n=1 Tax=Cavenderia fasciculata TaxID=261658 RepID=F4PLC5_CACFS|nr:PA14 domain-containing protein [Cavenderia fasciculata]EGG23347.1 PA14 domain-containing protein [Cavenderia fasciculata]|eukprot:XP_004361198.1 PA14 domain-containing protein [Cavenderia fasciculata]
MFRHFVGALLLCIGIFAIFSYAQNSMPMTVAIFDHHPSKDSNFEPADGSLTQGLVKKTLNPVTKVPELVSLDVNNAINVKGRIYEPNKFQYFFASDFTPAASTRFLNTTINLSKTGDYFEYFNDYFFPIDGTSSKRLGFDAESGYKLYYDGKTYHNYHFCLKMNTYFKYEVTDPVMQFNFRGDDDVYVFINNQLALDLGGLHTYQDGSITFDTKTVNNLGLKNGTIYPFDFFYCERHTTGSHMRFQINFPLDCSQKDFCGVCNGNGECCNPNLCTKYASGPDATKCKVGKCPPWNTPISDISQLPSYCIYTDVDYSSKNTKCATYTCDKNTGNPVATPTTCPALACTTQTCDPAQGCQYKSTCQPENICRVATCGSNNSTCNRADKDCSNFGTDKCKTYFCDTNVAGGCTSKAKCGSTVIENGVVNPCKYYTCDSAVGDCVVNTIANCDACTGTPAPCQVYDKCDANTGKWTFKPNPAIIDGNACTQDLCDPVSGAITHPFISCSGCTSCNPADNAYACKAVDNACQSIEFSNACTNNVCLTNGTCSYPAKPLPENPDACSYYTCDAQEGFQLNNVTCPDGEGACQVGVCDAKLGCQIAAKNCTSPDFCLEGYCDDRLGCLKIERQCTPGRPNCQVGVCNNETAECEYHDRDPYPFACKTAAVVSVGVIAGVVVAGAVALGVAVFGGKKGYDYWKEHRENKISAATSNPLYETKPGTGENPLYNPND